METAHLKFDSKVFSDGNEDSSLIEGIFWKASYSKQASSHLIAVGDDEKMMKNLLKKLREKHPNVIIFKEQIEKNKFLSRTLKQFGNMGHTKSEWGYIEDQ